MNTECIICLENISLEQNIYTCPQCKILVHINCKKNWEKVKSSNICPRCSYSENNNIDYIVQLDEINDIRNTDNLEIDEINQDIVYIHNKDNVYIETNEHDITYIFTSRIFYIVICCVIGVCFIGLFTYFIIHTFISYHYYFNITNV